MSQSIDNIILQISIEDKNLSSNIIDYWVADQGDNQLKNASSLLQDGIEIKIDLLNPLKLYKEKIIVNIYSASRWAFWQ